MQQDQHSQGEQHTHVHAVIVDGLTVYEGADMEMALRLWLEYGKDLNNRCVEHQVNGATLAVWGRAHEQE